MQQPELVAVLDDEEERKDDGKKAKVCRFKAFSAEVVPRAERRFGCPRRNISVIRPFLSVLEPYNARRSQCMNISHSDSLIPP